MQIVVLAGGLGTRLGQLTSETPKSLIPIHGKPFLEYQLDFLKRGGLENIILCVGYLGERIEKYFGDGKRFGVDIKYSYENQHLLGTAGALKNAKELLEDEFFVLYGDSYLFLDFVGIISYFRRYNKLALMTVYENHDRYDTSNVVIDGDKVKQYSKQRETKDTIYIDYGVSVLMKKALELVPPNQVYSLDKLFDQLVRQDELLAYQVEERFYHIGSVEGLEEFKKFFSQGKVVT